MEKHYGNDLVTKETDGYLPLYLSEQRIHIRYSICFFSFNIFIFILSVLHVFVAKSFNESILTLNYFLAEDWYLFC